jgi:hypothetical protein
VVDMSRSANYDGLHRQQCSENASFVACRRSQEDSGIYFVRFF